MKHILYMIIFLSVSSNIYAVSNPYTLPSSNEDKAKESNYGYIQLQNVEKI